VVEHLFHEHLLCKCWVQTPNPTKKNKKTPRILVYLTAKMTSYKSNKKGASWFLCEEKVFVKLISMFTKNYIKRLNYKSKCTLICLVCFVCVWGAGDWTQDLGFQFFFSGTGDGTQGLMLVRQTMYHHLSHSISPWLAFLIVRGHSLNLPHKFCLNLPLNENTHFLAKR
jgi:hypothetical protein